MKKERNEQKITKRLSVLNKHNATNSRKLTNFHELRQTKTLHLDATPYQIDKLDNAHFL